MSKAPECPVRARLQAHLDVTPIYADTHGPTFAVQNFSILIFTIITICIKKVFYPVCDGIEAVGVCAE